MNAYYVLFVLFLIYGGVFAHRGGRFDNGEEDRIDRGREGRGGRDEGEHQKHEKSFLCWLVFCPEGSHCEVLNEPAEWFIFSWVYCAEDQPQNGTTIASGSPGTGETSSLPESTAPPAGGNRTSTNTTVQPPAAVTSL